MFVCWVISLRIYLRWYVQCMTWCLQALSYSFFLSKRGCALTSSHEWMILEANWKRPWLQLSLMHGSICHFLLLVFWKKVGVENHKTGELSFLKSGSYGQFWAEFKMATYPNTVSVYNQVKFFLDQKVCLWFTNFGKRSSMSGNQWLCVLWGYHKNSYLK